MSIKYAVCGILPVTNGFFLSVSRKDDPNKIGFIGGKIDECENPEQALIREALEETCLHIEIDNSYEPFIEKDYTNGDTYMVYCYLVKLIDKEHEPICETETGLIRIASKQKLIDDSPWSEYNKDVFKWFNL